MIIVMYPVYKSSNHAHWQQKDHYIGRKYESLNKSCVTRAVGAIVHLLFTWKKISCEKYAGRQGKKCPRKIQWKITTLGIVCVFVLGEAQFNSPELQKSACNPETQATMYLPVLQTRVRSLHLKHASIELFLVHSEDTYHCSRHLGQNSRRCLATTRMMQERIPQRISCSIWNAFFFSI